MNRKHLLDNLTLEDFTRLANRKPDLEGDWIYYLNQSTLNEELKNPYPKFDLDWSQERLFLKFEDALDFLSNQNDKSIYCSKITQMPVGGLMCENGAQWLFDKDGQLIDYTTTHSFGDDINSYFFGCPEKRQRFEVGDIVEVITGKDVHLAVIYRKMLTVQKCYQVYKRYREDGLMGPFLDCTDDSLIVIDGPFYFCHDHVSPLQLMKPRFPIPPDLEAYMKTWYETANNEDNGIPHTYTPYRQEHQAEKGNKIGEFYEIEALLYYDLDNGMPLLHINDYYGLRACLRIDRAEYHDHNNYTGRLTAGQLRSLQSYLEMPDNGKSRWWYFLRDWNEDETNPPIPLDTQIPDYTTLIMIKKL